MKHLKLLMLFCSVAFTAAAQQFSGSGSGTAEDPYRITNADQLNEVRNVCGPDVFFSLEADIDMSSWLNENSPVTGWKPLGSGSEPFEGTFNGNGHVISNVWIDIFSDTAGLFGNATNAKLYGINIENANYNIENGGTLGGIVGILRENSAISDCSFQGELFSWTNDIGGIVGTSYADITNCHVKETKIGTSGWINNFGGIVGSLYGNISGCTFQGFMKCGNGVGGIAGHVEGDFIEDCHVDETTMTLASNFGSFGGIVSSFNAGGNGGRISKCSFNGTITAHGTYPVAVGGIAVSVSDNALITDCYTSGSISVEGRNMESFVGGILRSSTSSTQVINCYSNVDVETFGYGGGISASNNGTIRNCYFYGKVSGNTVGGICADNSGSITGCVAANAALSGVVAGRIAGVNTGTLETTQNYALAEMEVTVGGELQNVVDSPENGTARSKADLMKQATYRAMEWDFTNTWKIDEGTSFPYLPDFYVPVTEITLNNAGVSLDKGLTLGIVATILPENAHNTTVLWSSSNASVATVDCNGLVTAIAAGEAEITATSAGSPEVKAICQVTVNQKLVETIALDKTELSMEKGATWQLMATVMPEDADDKSVTWISSDTGVATVDDNGLVTAVEAGSATITATTNDGSNLSANCSVTVTDPTSGIDNVGVGNVDVSTAKGRIMISGKSGDVPVVVYTLTGQLVHSGNENVIDVTGSSLYIVRIMGNSYKVFVP